MRNLNLKMWCRLHMLHKPEDAANILPMCGRPRNIRLEGGLTTINAFARPAHMVTALCSARVIVASTPPLFDTSRNVDYIVCYELTNNNRHLSY